MTGGRTDDDDDDDVVQGGWTGSDKSPAAARCEASNRRRPGGALLRNQHTCMAVLQRLTTHSKPHAFAFVCIRWPSAHVHKTTQACIRSGRLPVASSMQLTLRFRAHVFRRAFGIIGDLRSVGQGARAGPR